MVVASGMACAITMQYFPQLLYDPSGIVITSPVPAVKATAVEIIKLSHKRHVFLQAIIISPYSIQGRLLASPIELSAIQASNIQLTSATASIIIVSVTKTIRVIAAIRVRHDICRNWAVISCSADNLRCVCIHSCHQHRILVCL